MDGLHHPQNLDIKHVVGCITGNDRIQSSRARVLPTYLDLGTNGPESDVHRYEVGLVAFAQHLKVWFDRGG
jgi:hypothetical protein